MTMDKPSYGEQSDKGHFEQMNTFEIEQERLRQMVLSVIASRCDTDQLNADLRQNPPIAWKKPSSDGGMISPERFTTLPHGLIGRAAPHWLIQIDSLGIHPTVGVELVSDVVLGVSRNAVSLPDFDFAPYNGVDLGVSRRHAMLRPSATRLYLIDLASKNGTRLNGLALDSNRPTPISHGDLISLGGLTFCIHLIATPSDYSSAQYP